MSKPWPGSEEKYAHTSNRAEVVPASVSSAIHNQSTGSTLPFRLRSSRTPLIYFQKAAVPNPRGDQRCFRRPPFSLPQRRQERTFGAQATFRAHPQAKPKPLTNAEARLLRHAFALSDTPDFPHYVNLSRRVGKSPRCVSLWYASRHRAVLLISLMRVAGFSNVELRENHINPPRGTLIPQ